MSAEARALSLRLPPHAIRSLRVKLFDLPAVATRAQARFARAGFADRAEAFGGSFLSDPLPRGADVISLVRVLHDHDDAAVMQALRAVREALPEGGVILIAEPFAGTPGAEAMGDGYFGFYLLAMGQGRPRTGARTLRHACKSGLPADPAAQDTPSAC